MTAILNLVADLLRGSNGVLALALLVLAFVPLWGHDRLERRAGR